MTALLLSCATAIVAAPVSAQDLDAPRPIAGSNT
jgi:hypothetical protein